MKIETVEIYSDASNMAVMRHPGRNFPGSLIQGDSLYSMVQDLTEVRTALLAGNVAEAIDGVEYVLVRLEERLSHYKDVLSQHGVELPFHDKPRNK